MIRARPTRLPAAPNRSARTRAAQVSCLWPSSESVGTDADDPRFVQLVGELSLSSERFRRLWARHDVQSREGMPARIHHPQVGDLTLSREKLAIGGAQGQLLAIYHAQPGTSSAEKLGLRASLASPTAPAPATAAHKGTSDATPRSPGNAAT